MNETWIQIPGYERYYVSNLGNVKSIYKYRPEKHLKQGVTEKGYAIVYLSKECKQTTSSVHRLVAKAFLPNPNNHPQINHKDEDKMNNSVDNLEWCDGFYNQEYSHAKCFQFVSPSGEIVNVFNLNKFCRDNQLPVGNMHRLHTGVHKKIKGWSRYQESS